MATVWTNLGQQHGIDVLDPATRSAAPATYYGAWGSGTVAPAVTDTAITAHPEARVAVTVSQPTPESIRYAFTLTATAARSVTECGVFDASTAGNLLTRTTFTAIAAELDDVIAFEIDVPLKDISEP